MENLDSIKPKKITNWYAMVSAILAIVYTIYLFLLVTPCNQKGLIIANPSEGTLKVINFVMWILLLATLIFLIFAIYMGIKKFQRRGVNLSFLVLAFFILLHGYLLIFRCS